MPWLVTIALIVILSGCDKEGRSPLITNEIIKLEQRVSKINQQLANLGFPLDLSEIAIDVKEDHEMAALFNQINDESVQEVKNYTPFGPQALADDNSTLAVEVLNNKRADRLAFYDANSKTIIFKKGASRELANGYLAHELAHVYQDQKWGFNNIWKSYHNKPSRELFNVTQFIIEGHAELVRKAYEQKYAKTSKIKKALGLSLGKISTSDCFNCDTQEPLENLPYSLGLRFLVNEYRAGGWPLVESYFDNLPASTEQIIHPSKQKLDQPLDITIPTWEDDTINPKLNLNASLGEAFLLSKLLSLQVAPEEAFLSASGWDGDVAQFYLTDDGKDALVWRIVFDRKIDAQQLETALTNAGHADGFFRVGRVVDWIITKHPELKRNLRIFLSKHPMTIKSDLSDEQSTLEQEENMKDDTDFYQNFEYVPTVVIGANLSS